MRFVSSVVERSSSSRDRLQPPDLVLAQLAPLTRLQLRVPDGADRHTFERGHRVTDRVAHLSHLTVSSFANRDDQVAGTGDLHVRRLCAAILDRHTLRQPIDVVAIGFAEHPHVVHARDAVARMRETRGEIAVVGEQEQTFGVEVEPPDRIYVFADAAQKIDHGRTPLRIGSRRHVPARLVEQQVAVMFRDFHTPAVDADVVARRVGFRAELADCLAVDGDASLEHQLLARAARGDARLRENLLETLHR